MPSFQQAEGTIIIGPMPGPELSILTVSDDWGGAQLNGLILSEYCQLFWLASTLREDHRNIQSLVLSQYRKLLSVEPGRQRASNAPYTFVATPSEASRVNLSDSQIEGLSSRHKTHLIGPVINIGSTIENYARYHLLPDFLRFCDQMLVSRRFSPELVARFANCNALIPAPSLGVHRIDEFLNDMDTLRHVWELFFRACYVKRDGYQRRVGGFLMERLHSFLIYERLRTNPEQYLIGHQYVVVEHGSFAQPTI